MAQDLDGTLFLARVRDAVRSLIVGHAQVSVRSWRDQFNGKTSYFVTVQFSDTDDDHLGVVISFPPRMQYTLNDVARGLVERLKEVCEAEGVPVEFATGDSSKPQCIAQDVIDMTDAILAGRG